MVKLPFGNFEKYFHIVHSLLRGRGGGIIIFSSMNHIITNQMLYLTLYGFYVNCVKIAVRQEILVER